MVPNDLEEYIMQKALAKLVADHLGGRVYEEYSGRAMYGKKTTGVVVPDLLNFMGALYELSEAISEMQETGELEASENFRYDNLGRDMIVY